MDNGFVNVKIDTPYVEQKHQEIGLPQNITIYIKKQDLNRAYTNEIRFTTGVGFGFKCHTS